MDQVVALGNASEIEVARGERVSIGCRPEQIKLVPDDEAPGCGPVLWGIVEDVTFLGSSVRIRLRHGEQLLEIDQVSDSRQAPPLRGERRGCLLRPEACHVLRAPAG